jgi:hypothetical protein
MTWPGVVLTAAEGSLAGRQAPEGRQIKAHR